MLIIGLRFGQFRIIYTLSLSLSLSHNTLLLLRACSLRDVRVFALGPVLPLRWDGDGLSDALSSCRLSRDRLNLRRQETEEAERAYDVSKDIMQNSSSTYLEVLAAQQTLIQAQLEMASDWFDHIQSRINLFKALGGTLSSAKNPLSIQINHQ